MNYRKTAEALNMTQPAVTQHIQYLEQEYGCRLFIYDKKTLYMTRDAEILREYAENAVYQERKARNRIHAHNGRHLSIGATKTIGEFVIADKVAEYLSEKGNTISIEVDNTEKLLSMLSDGRIDFALIEGMFDRSKYAYKLYREEPFVGICYKDHRFAGKRVPMDELFGEHLLLREEGSGTRDIFEQLLKEHSHSLAEFSKVTTIGNFGLMKDILKRVNGITFAYRALHENDEDLAEFYLDRSEIVREFNYVYLDNPFAFQAVESFAGRDKY